jgi:hypothetical protein
VLLVACMHQNAINLRHTFAYVLGAVEALLVARLLLRLLAARPDNPVFAILFTITSPPRALAALDAAQPRFGATLEFSTLALALALPVVALLLVRVWKARARRA